MAHTVSQDEVILMIRLDSEHLVDDLGSLDVVSCERNVAKQFCKFCQTL